MTKSFILTEYTENFTFTPIYGGRKISISISTQEI